MKKKTLLWLLLIILLIVIILVFLLLKKEDTSKYQNLLDLKEYSAIKIDKIESINILKYTEGGVESLLEENKSEIKSTMKSLSKIKVGKESKSACEDNTTVYVIKQQEQEYTIEIECENIVLNNKRYQIKK